MQVVHLKNLGKPNLIIQFVERSHKNCINIRHLKSVKSVTSYHNLKTMSYKEEVLKDVVIKFAGDSGDGMQVLSGTIQQKIRKGS